MGQSFGHDRFTSKFLNCNIHLTELFRPNTQSLLALLHPTVKVQALHVVESICPRNVFYSIAFKVEITITERVFKQSEFSSNCGILSSLATFSLNEQKYLISYLSS